jgi:glucosylceramidase
MGGRVAADVAFRNRDGSLALIALNDDSSAQTFSVSDGSLSFTATLPARALATYVWD